MRKSVNDKIGEQKAEVSSGIHNCCKRRKTKHPSSREPAVLPVVTERVRMVLTVSISAEFWNASTGECMSTKMVDNRVQREIGAVEPPAKPDKTAVALGVLLMPCNNDDTQLWRSEEVTYAGIEGLKTESPEPFNPLDPLF